MIDEFFPIALAHQNTASLKYAQEAFWKLSDWIHAATDTMWMNQERGDFEFREFLREAESRIERPIRGD